MLHFLAAAAKAVSLATTIVTGVAVSIAVVQALKSQRERAALIDPRNAFRRPGE